MSKAITKVVLSASRDIPFDKLRLSQSNVRRIKCGVSIPALAEDIAERTLLQSLSVRAVVDGEGRETGRFEVPAGGRRFRALELLVKSKRMAKDQLVPCVIREGGNAVEDSYAENMQRAPLHPLDQFRAFRERHEAGVTEEEIAARFMVSVGVVRQRLRLAAVSEKLLQLYAGDEMNLDQLMAFTVSTDHARQEQVWEAACQNCNYQPWYIRRMLTEHSVAANDRRARFVGLETYEAAGGPVQRDLFAADDGGWLEDIGLLDRLVDARLRAEAETVAAEGWKWVEAGADLPYGFHHGLRKIAGNVPERSEAEQATLDARLSEFDALTDDWEDCDDLPEEIDERIVALEAEIATLMNPPRQFGADDLARGGAFVTIASDGTLVVDRGYVRREDEPSVAISEGGEGGADVSGTRDAAITLDGRATDDDPEDGDAIKPLPERLVSELTAERTLALRDALAQVPEIAFFALVHALVLSAFRPYESGNCIQIAVRPPYLGAVAPSSDRSLWSKSVKVRHDGWSERLPSTSEDLWDAIATMDPGDRFALLAHCVSLGVNALFEPASRHNEGSVSAHVVSKRIASADRLAAVIGHDMARAGWQPSRVNYLDRVTKPRILEAVREARGEEMVELIAHMKKGDMAAEAERLLEGTGWLPRPLRLPHHADESEVAGEGDAAALPAFLANDDEQGFSETAAGETDAQAIAAE